MDRRRFLEWFWDTGLATAAGLIYIPKLMVPNTKIVQNPFRWDPVTRTLYGPSSILGTDGVLYQVVECEISEAVWVFPPPEPKNLRVEA